MKITLFDAEESESLKPLTFTKPVGELRMGILSFKERWEKLLGKEAQYLTREYLQGKFPFDEQQADLFINPAFFPSENLVKTLLSLNNGESLYSQERLIAYKGIEAREKNNKINFTEEALYIQHPWDLFSHNDFAIRFDFDLVTKGRKSQPLSETNRAVALENIFIEEGAVVEFAILNAKEGPIYIGRDAEIMEGTVVRGSLALCEYAKLNLATKVYSGTTVGPYCKVGGEINNSILMGYSNKGHDGFLGNSVLGEWCNLGADTNNSNMKNNYSMVKVWSYPEQRFINTGLQFCGLVMGDHSKAAINTQFNTGTVTGVCANIFEAGFPPTKISSFTWGGHKDSPIYALDKAYETAERMMKRRGILLTNEDKLILSHIFNETNN